MNTNYYAKLLEAHGPTYAAIDAGSDYTHRRRLQVLTEPIRSLRSTILDVGCGLGHLIDYGHGLTLRGYHGIDVLPDMIVAAKKRFPGWHFEVGDIDRPKEEWRSDYVVASGLFQFSDMERMEHRLAAMYRLCRCAVAANFLRHGAKDEGVVHPLTILRYGLRLTQFVTLRADYLPNDFTVYLYKERS